MNPLDTVLTTALVTGASSAVGVCIWGAFDFPVPKRWRRARRARAAAAPDAVQEMVRWKAEVRVRDRVEWLIRYEELLTVTVPPKHLGLTDPRWMWPLSHELDGVRRQLKADLGWDHHRAARRDARRYAEFLRDYGW